MEPRDKTHHYSINNHLSYQVIVLRSYLCVAEICKNVPTEMIIGITKALNTRFDLPAPLHMRDTV